MKKKKEKTHFGTQKGYATDLPNNHGVLVGSFLALLGIQAGYFAGAAGEQPPRNLKQRPLIRRSSSAAAKLSDERREVAGATFLKLGIQARFFLCRSPLTANGRITNTHLMLTIQSILTQTKKRKDQREKGKIEESMIKTQSLNPNCCRLGEKQRRKTLEDRNINSRKWVSR